MISIQRQEASGEWKEIAKVAGFIAPQSNAQQSMHLWTLDQSGLWVPNVPQPEYAANLGTFTWHVSNYQLEPAQDAIDAAYTPEMQAQDAPYIEVEPLDDWDDFDEEDEGSDTYQQEQDITEHLFNYMMQPFENKLRSIDNNHPDRMSIFICGSEPTGQSDGCCMFMPGPFVCKSPERELLRRYKNNRPELATWEREFQQERQVNR